MTAAPPSGSTPQPPNSPGQISRWIEQLGSDRFTTRRKARRALADLGLPAFDQLLAARDHPDAEIAATARALTLDPDINWSRPTDSTDVIELLGQYRDENSADRRETIDRLSQLPPAVAASPLLRLARYESDESLARAASIAFLEIADPALPSTDRDRLLQILFGERSVGENRLSHHQWLDRRGEDLAAGTLDTSAWSTLIDQQQRGLVHTDAPATTDLLRVVQTIAIQWPETSDRSAVDFLLAQLELLSPQTQSIADLAAWAIDHRLADFVPAIAEHYPAFFEQSPRLQYLLAEAAGQRGDEALADQTLARLEASHPLLAESDPPIDRATGDRLANARMGVAIELQRRGQFDWAGREYRWIIDSLPIESMVRADAALQLASMNIERQRYAEVVDQLEPLIERLDADDDLSEELLQRSIPSYQFRSLLDYARGEVAAAAGLNDQAAAAYGRALAADPENIDILIAMYRLPGDESWRRSVITTLEQHVAIAEQKIRNAPIARRFGSGKSYLAKLLNHYAWLIANTEGDKFLALQYSKRSLRLEPGRAAQMDTCARCYYAIGNLDEAIAMQRQAVALEPHSPPLRRQLATFEAAAAP